MGTTKIKLDSSLMERVEKFSAAAGYSSPEEFVTHCLEKELARFEEGDSSEEIEKKLKGLGYIS
jgi:hypothetical protein